MKEHLFSFIAGTGGIGTGRFFKLEENHTLGRNESRLATLTDNRDYCKLHIILHYIAVFLRNEIPVYAIGRIGADDAGRLLKKEMENAGIDCSFVTEDSCSPTMFAICGQYPNGEGFNITAGNSACAAVSVEDVNRFFDELDPVGNGIVIAAPEVPLEPRIHLLKKGRQKNCFNVATVLSGEAAEFARQDGIVLTDLIALNVDEALAFASLGGGKTGTEREIVNSCVTYMQSHNAEITVIVTLGGSGAYVQYMDRVYTSDAMAAPVVNTAGAGDCFLGTVVAAMVRGADIFPHAMDLGIMAAAKKIGCKDTIDFSMTADSLELFAREHGIIFMV